MKIQIISLGMTDQNHRKFYNTQDMGLGRALSAMGHNVDMYSFIQGDTDEIVEFGEHLRMNYLHSRSFGFHSLHDASFITPDVDAVICFADNQINFRRIVKQCRKYGIVCLPYVGTLDSHNASSVKKRILDIFASNMRYYRNMTTLAKTPDVKRQMKEKKVTDIVVAPCCLDLNAVHRFRENQDADSESVGSLRASVGFSSDDKVILYLARLIDEKHPLEMLDIFNELHSADPSYKMISIGQGELKTEFEEKIDALHLRDAILRIDSLPNSEVWKYYRMADVMVNLNRVEIFGMAILEAMYYECPVVARSAPGPEYILTDDVDGYLCDDSKGVIARVRQLCDTGDDDYADENVHHGGGTSEQNAGENSYGVGATESNAGEHRSVTCRERIVANAKRRVMNDFVWESTAQIMLDVVRSKQNKIKILHIMHEIHPSGAEMMLYNAYPYWEADCDATVMATGRQIGPFADAMEKRGYKIAYVPTGSPGNASGQNADATVRTAMAGDTTAREAVAGRAVPASPGKLDKLHHLARFRRFMKHNRYDVVHIHRESLSFWYALIAKLHGSRAVVRTVHSTFSHRGISRSIKKLTRHIMKDILRVKFIAISDGVAVNERKVFGIECDEVIYNWCDNRKYVYIEVPTPQNNTTDVPEPQQDTSAPQNNTADVTEPQQDTSAPQNDTTDAPASQNAATDAPAVSRDIPESQPTSPLTLLTVGNCGDVKNHTLLIEAIAQMKHREDIHYIHVGYAQAETEKEMRLAKELGIASQIEFAGSCDPYPYLARADVFVMTSRYEGLSIATLEAIFTGIPVLLADVPGLDEFKGKGLENVFYYKPEINALANALDDMADRHATGDLHRSRAQSERAAELYDCRRQALKYLEVWKDLTK